MLATTDFVQTSCKVHTDGPQLSGATLSGWLQPLRYREGSCCEKIGSSAKALERLLEIEEEPHCRG